jgi:hypothetical protein
MRRPSAPEDIMTRYSPRRPQAAPKTAPAWFVAALLAAAALVTAITPVFGSAEGIFH